MEIEQHSQSILEGVQQIIENGRTKVAVFLNTETTLLYWQIGDYINQQLLNGDRAQYGAKIVATVSQQLTIKNGRGYSYSALT